MGRLRKINQESKSKAGYIQPRGRRRNEGLSEREKESHQRSQVRNFKATVKTAKYMEDIQYMNDIQTNEKHQAIVMLPPSKTREEHGHL